jgi:predicted nucleic acid-binding protein
VADEQLVYLDSSAFVKLVIPEPETAALVAALTASARLVASEILEVEALRAARTADGEDGAAAARAQLAGVRLLPLTDDIRGRASELEPATLRSLDAIHIATALDLGERLACVYAYDTRMANAASQAGLQVYAPTPEQPTGEQRQALEPRSAEST